MDLVESATGHSTGCKEGADLVMAMGLCLPRFLDTLLVDRLITIFDEDPDR